MRLLSVVTVFLASACAPVTWTANARGFQDAKFGGIKQAAFDMQCPEKSLDVVDLGPNSVGVKGCDKQAMY